MHSYVTVSIPGTSARMLLEQTDWPEQCPEGAKSLEDGEWRRRGTGRILVASLDREHAHHLRDFLTDHIHGLIQGGVGGVTDVVLWQRALRRVQDSIDKAE